MALPLETNRITALREPERMDKDKLAFLRDRTFERLKGMVSVDITTPIDPAQLVQVAWDYFDVYLVASRRVDGRAVRGETLIREHLDQMKDPAAVAARLAGHYESMAGWEDRHAGISWLMRFIDGPPISLGTYGEAAVQSEVRRDVFRVVANNLRLAAGQIE